MRNLKLTLIPVLLVVLLQLYSRYVPFPVTGFCTDDWPYLEWGAHRTYAQIWRQAAVEPDRPLYAGGAISLFRFFGANPLAFGLLGMAVYSLVILLVYRLADELTGNRLAAFTGAALFALLPNLTESFHWAIIISFAYIQAAYVGSAWMLARFARSGRRSWLAGAVLLYAVGAFTYEVGLGLPAAFLVLLWDRADRRKVLWILPFALVLGAYLLWRFTSVFGLGHRTLYAPVNVQIEWSFAQLRWNAAEVLRWWVGGHALEILANGWRGFRQYPLGLQVLLGLGNLVVALGLCAQVLRMRRDPGGPAPFSLSRVLVFAGIWFVVALGPSFLLYTAPRVLFFPAVGLCLGAGALLARVRPVRWLPPAAVLALIFLAVNQGTTQQWRQSGQFNQNLYDHLRATAGQWARSEILLFDTRELRARAAAGRRSDPADPALWARNGNAPLLRGFAPMAMVALLRPGKNNPQCVLDVEHGARLEADRLFWHDRYDPSRPHETDRRAVFVVDCQLVGFGVR